MRDARSTTGFQKLVSVQWTSSGRSPNVNADTLREKKTFHDLSFSLSHHQLVREEDNGTYLG